MNWMVLRTLIPYFASLILSFSLAVYAYKHRRIHGVKEYVVFLASQSAYTLGAIFELTSPTLSGKIIWDCSQWISLIVAILAFLLFCLRFTQTQVVHPVRFWILVTAIPVLFLGLMVTNGLHGLVLPNPRLIAGEPFSSLHYNFTKTVIFVSAYFSLIVLAGIVVLITRFAKPHQLYKTQVSLIILGVAIPLVSSLLTLFNLTSAPRRDILPFSSILGCSVIALGLFRYRIFQVVPVARDAVFENLPDLVIVLDGQNRILDLNPQAKNILSRGGKSPIGMAAKDALSSWPELVEKYKDATHAHSEIAVEWKGAVHHLDLNLSPLLDQNQVKGRVIVLRDITSRVELEIKLKEHQDSLKHLVQIRTAALEKANRRLKKEVLERAKAEAEIQKNLEEKEVLLQEIHHRVKNNLQVISSLISLQMENTSDRKAQEILKISQNRVRSIAMIHEHLYRTKDLSRIHMDSYLPDFIRRLYEAYNIDDRKIQCEIKIDPVSLTMDRAVPCSLIMNELLTNAFKYSFPPKFKGTPTIRISLQEKNGQFDLEVGDNGIGLPKGFDFRKTQTLGMKLIAILAEKQLDGTVVVKNDPGASFLIRFQP